MRIESFITGKPQTARARAGWHACAALAIMTAALNASLAFGARVSFEAAREPRQMAQAGRISTEPKEPEKEPGAAVKEPDKEPAKEPGAAAKYLDKEPAKEPGAAASDAKAAGEEEKSAAPSKPAVLSIEGQVTDEPELRCVGQRLSYVVTVAWQGDVDLSAPEAPSLSGLEYANLRTRDEVNGGQVRRQYLFELKALTEGPVSIGKVKIYYTDKGTGKAERDRGAGGEL